MLLSSCANPLSKAYGFALVDLVPSSATDLKTQSETVAGAIDAAIKAFSGIGGLKKRSMRFGRRNAVVAA
jgi:hypothetical protein